MCIGSIHTLSDLRQLEIHAVVNMVGSCNLQVGSSGHWKPSSIVTKSREWGRLPFTLGMPRLPILASWTVMLLDQSGASIHLQVLQRRFCRLWAGIRSMSGLCRWMAWCEWLHSAHPGQLACYCCCIAAQTGAAHLPRTWSTTAVLNQGFISHNDVHQCCACRGLAAMADGKGVLQCGC